MRSDIAQMKEALAFIEKIEREGWIVKMMQATVRAEYFLLHIHEQD